VSRLVFAGTPEFAREALLALAAAGHELLAVFTQPDRPSGRGMKLAASPVKETALAAGIPVFQPRSLRLDGRYPDDAAAARQALTALMPDVMVVAAYGLILPQWVLDLPRHGCLNIHASLLPRWRGAAPIQRAIEAGDATSGVTIMQMDAGLDTGAVVARAECAIAADETGASLHDRLASLGARTIVQVLSQLDAGVVLPVRPQPADGVCYAAKLMKSEAALDFSQPAKVLARRIRAFDPLPGASLMLPGLDQPVKVWAALALPTDPRASQSGAVLRVASDGIDVATADGVLRLLVLQKAGGKRQPVDVFVRGWKPQD
jgi:methionyl-tRNA formyltransferase